MDGRKFLKVAEELLQGKTSAHWRSAASRAYYGLLLEGREALRRWGFLPNPGDNVHAFVRLRFSYALDADLKEVGRALDRLVRLRNKADYELLAAEFQSVAEATNAFDLATESLRLLDGVDRDPVRQAAAAADMKAQWP